MTNLERWRSYTSGLSSPDNYIDWSWYYLVSAALQRKVWLGPPNQKCFPNMYVILCGKPGIGKGNVIKEVSSFLRHWPLDLSNVNGAAVKDIQDKLQAESVAETDLKRAQEFEHQGRTKGAESFKPTLIPIAPDAITYQALVDAIGNSYRRINYRDKEDKMQTYGHSSICFSLQELGSLMRKNMNDVITFLLGLYDCPEDYEYVSLTRGKDRVKRGCLNMLAGTTPSFMQSTFDDKLTDEGWSSRTFYVCAMRNRKSVFRMPDLTEEQLEHKRVLLDHIKKLACLYGPVYESRETVDFMEEWWSKFEKNPKDRPNKNLKMNAYYGRRNIHTQKLATAMHFSESTEMELTIPEYQTAMGFLNKEEVNMHIALTLEGNNPTAKVSRRILDLCAIEEKNFVDLLSEVYTIGMDSKGIEEVINILEITNQLSRREVEDKDTEKTITYWRTRE